MLRIVSLTVLLSIGSTATPAEKVPPAVEVHLRAMSDMLDVFDFLGKLAPKDETFQQYLKVAKLIGESKNGFLGFDPTKPVGAYVGIAAEVADSPVVLMVPVVKESDFLGLLRTYLKLDPKKLKEGLYSFPVPQIPAGPAYIRFAHGYAYITIRSVESIDPERLIQPKDFFAEKQSDILNAKVFIDRFPADIRRSILGQLELGWHETIAMKGGCPLCRWSWLQIVDWAAGTAKRLMEDGKVVELALKVEPKANAASLYLQLQPRTESGLEKYLREAGCGTEYTLVLPLDARTIQSFFRR